MDLRISAVMLTCDRSPKKNYVEDSLKSLQDSGFFENPSFKFTLINTKGSRNGKFLEFLADFYTPLQVMHTESRIHYNSAMAFGLEYAAQTDCDIVLFMEDDIKVCSDFPQRVIEFISHYSDEHVMWDFTTFYQEIVSQYYKGLPYLDMDADKFYGNQCLALRKDAALSYASFIRKEYPKRSGFADIWYSDWLSEVYGIKRIRCAVPSLAQHIGRQSNHGHDVLIAPGFADDIERENLEVYLPVKSGDFHQTLTEKGVRVLNINQQNKSIDLSASAWMIFNLCDGKRKTIDIIKYLRNEFPGNDEDIYEQVPNTIDELKIADLLQ